MDDDAQNEKQIDAWTEIAADGVMEKLEEGSLTRDTAYTYLRDFARALTHAPCGCRFYAHPHSTEDDWLMKYCLRHGG